jgi:hypothetical protein
MKRSAHLIEPIADMANLELAFHKAKRGKAVKAQVQAFGKNLRANLKALQAQILSGEVEIGNYHYFTVYDPKKRQICAAPFAQRVLHHALINVCHPYFERQQIHDSYASRIGKGTYAALERAGAFNRRHTWYLKLDVRKYFDSIHHGVLRSRLCRLFKDPCLLRIFDRILDSYEALPGRGVPIGNLTSQYFANDYLSPADHFARETLRVPAYVRYMDDMVLWHDDKAALLEAGCRFQDFIRERLQQELKPFCLNKNTTGLPFLGYLIYPDTVRLAQRSRRRYIQKIKICQSALESGVWSQKEFQNHATPLTAFTNHANAKAFRQKVHASLGV